MKRSASKAAKLSRDELRELVDPGETPTLKTIARISGLAVATVSRALSDAPDILSPVVIGKPEVVIQSGANVVAIQNLGEVTLLVECPLKGVGNGRLAGSGVPVEPENDGPLFQQRLLVVPSKHPVEFWVNILHLR